MSPALLALSETILDVVNGSLLSIDQRGVERIIAAVHEYEKADEFEPAYAESEDWTRSESGRSNSSEEFLRLCDEVEHIIRGDAHMLINGHAESTARLIMAQLAHVHGVRPGPKPKPKTVIHPDGHVLELVSFDEVMRDD